MADLVLVSAAVIADSTGQFLQGTAGFAATAGAVCCLDPTTNRYVLALASDEDLRQARGIACHQAAPGQPLRLLTQGTLGLGADVLTPGELYVASAANPGGIAPIGDLASGTNYTTVLGQAVDSQHLQVRVVNYPTPRA